MTPDALYLWSSSLTPSSSSSRPAFFSIDIRSRSLTFSSKAYIICENYIYRKVITNISSKKIETWHLLICNTLWCSNSDLSALRTSTSLDTPDWDAACRLTTVILRDRSCLDTRHSKCSNNNLVLFLSAFSSVISSSFSRTCSRLWFNSLVSVANSWKYVRREINHLIMIVIINFVKRNQRFYKNFLFFHKKESLQNP